MSPSSRSVSSQQNIEVDKAYLTFYRVKKEAFQTSTKKKKPIAKISPEVRCLLCAKKVPVNYTCVNSGRIGNRYKWERIKNKKYIYADITLALALMQRFI